MNSVEENTNNLGEIFDKEDKAKELNKSLEKKIKDVKAKADKSDKKAMYLLANEGELSTYGPGARFGSLIFDVLDVKPVDKDLKASTHGQPVSFEYISEKNPDIIYAMDRGKAMAEKKVLTKHYQTTLSKMLQQLKKTKL